MPLTKLLACGNHRDLTGKALQAPVGISEWTSCSQGTQLACQLARTGAQCVLDKLIILGDKGLLEQSIFSASNALLYCEQARRCIATACWHDPKWQHNDSSQANLLIGTVKTLHYTRCTSFTNTRAIQRTENVRMVVNIHC